MEPGRASQSWKGALDLRSSADSKSSHFSISAENVIGVTGTGLKKKISLYNLHFPGYQSG